MRIIITILLMSLCCTSFSNEVDAIDSVKTYSSYILYQRTLNQGSYFQCFDTLSHPKPNTNISLTTSDLTSLSTRLCKLKILKKKPNEFCIVLIAELYVGNQSHVLAIDKLGKVYFKGSYYKKSKKLYKLLTNTT